MWEGLKSGSPSARNICTDFVCLWWTRISYKSVICVDAVAELYLWEQILRWQFPNMECRGEATHSIILQFLTIYARNRLISLFAFFGEWYVVERCICVAETIVNRQLFDSGVILPTEHFQITNWVYFNYLSMKKRTEALRHFL